MAYVLARTTVYTITTARVAMRVGAALTVTLNLPFTRIASADLAVNRDGTGSVGVRDIGRDPAQLPRSLAPCPAMADEETQPALRSIPDAAEVAQIVADAAETRVSQPEIASRAASGTPVAAE